MDRKNINQQKTKIKVKKGDTVAVLSGKDKGKKGKVLRVIYKTGRVVVEGLNILKKHQKPTRNFQGGIIERPGAMYVSKVQIVCPKCSEKSRIGSLGQKRVCKKCGEVIDKE